MTKVIAIEKTRKNKEKSKDVFKPPDMYIDRWYAYVYVCVLQYYSIYASMHQRDAQWLGQFVFSSFIRVL